MSSKQDTDKLSDRGIDTCCDDNKSVFLATYSSGRTWLLCPYCSEDEAFKNGLTSKTRIGS